jgi:polysaccharide biosynthesis/export protein
LVGLVLSVEVLSGCAPKNIGRYNDLAFGDTRRHRNQIIKSFDDWYSDVHYWIQGEIEESEDFPGPTAADLRPAEGDYILGPGDVIQITIQDLVAQNQAYQQPVRVTEEGTISLPFSYLQDVKAKGFTLRGLERRVTERLKPPDGPIVDPRVSVFILERVNRTFAVVAGVARPGIYPLRSHNQTLFEALSDAGGVNPFHEQYMYVIRKMTEEELAEVLLRAWAEEAEEKAKEQADSPESIAEVVGDPTAGAADEPTDGESVETDAPDRPLTDEEELQAVAEGRKPKVRDTVPLEEKTSDLPEPGEGDADLPTPETEADSGRPGWKFENGMWVKDTAAETDEDSTESADGADTIGEPPKPGGEEISPALKARLYRMGVVDGGGEGLVRIIRIDVAALLAGDPSQDIVMRHGDRINIPEPPAGEWYINGEVVRRGVYSLTGRKLTLLQAIAAAGGLTELAIPKRTELVRRVSEEAEEIIYVDLGKIAKGEAPDFYLQPNDYINVGTDQGAIFLAVLRNAFRATYGFGLVYDQNFADIYPWKGGIHPLFGM